MTFTHALGTNNYGTAKFIVSTSAANGTHTTLASALAVASSGDTIFLRDSVTEDVTLIAGVNITAWTGGTLNTPTITGKMSFAAAGTVNISGIRLTTNSDYFLAVTGSAASIVNLTNCYLNCSNNAGINYTSSSASSAINVYLSKLNVNGAQSLHVMTSIGTLTYFGCDLDGAKNSTASTNTAGAVIVKFCELPCPFSNSTNGYFVFDHVKMAILTANPVVVNGTSANNSDFRCCALDGGNNASITIGAAATAQVYDCALRTGGAPTVTGSGTFEYSGISTTTAAGAISATTQTPRPFFPGLLTMPPAGTGGTATSNTMTTYEEGTFTPTLLGAGAAGTPTYVVQQGYYTKIGNMVKCWVQLQISAHTGTGDATFGGFPFTIKNQTSYSPVGVMVMSSTTWVWPGTRTQVSIFGTPNSTNAVCAGTASGVVISNTQMQNAAATFRYELCYQVA